MVEVRVLSRPENAVRLHRPNTFGGSGRGCRLWNLLELDRFWDRRLACDGRSGVFLGKVLQLLVVNQLVERNSEFRLHRRWSTDSAMDELLQVDRAAVGR